MKPHHLLTACFAIAAMFTPSLHAAILLNENFSDGDFSNADLPSSAAWYIIGSGSPSLRIDDGRFYAQTTTAAAIGLTTAFAGPGGYTLGTGETIRVSFYMTTDFKGAGAADAFRFGLFSSNGMQITASGAGANGADPAFNAWRGYSMWIPFGDVSSTNASLREKTGNNNTLFAGGANSVLTTVPYTSGAFNNTSEQHAVLSLTNNGSSVTITASLGSTTTTWTDETPTALTFDSFSLFAASSSISSQGALVIGSIQVEVVPEPAVPAMLAFIAPIGIFLRRRRA